MRTRLKLSISWLILALGCLAGLIACVGLGLDVVSLSDRSPAWYLGWSGAIGMALLGLAFLIGSLVALQHRRLAGVIFLAVMPVGAFCLAYPGSGFLVWRDGGGWFETPFPTTAIGLAILFYAPFLPPLLMWRRKKRAAIAFALTAFIAGLIFACSRWTPALLPRLVGWSVPFLLPGLFWVRTDRLGWPSLVQARPWSLTKRVSAFAATCAAMLCLDVVLTVVLCGLGTSLFNGDCGERQPFLHPLSPTQAVFTARVVFAARSIDALGAVHSALHLSGRDRKVGDWAIGIVQERFWGMPHWTRLVLLTNYVYWEGETYFVDGRRAEGLLTQFLPIVEGGISCSRTKPMQDAIVDLRLLRRPPLPGATRVIGYVRGPEIFTPGIVRPRKPPSSQERHTRVRVTWADGTAVAGLHVCVAYENTDDYESLAGKHCIKEADQNGLAVIRTYGGSQVRVFAEQFVYRDDQQLPDRFHSQPVQYAADQIPNTVNLVLTPSNDSVFSRRNSKRMLNNGSGLQAPRGGWKRLTVKE
jgi:hypothetical protein